MSWGLVVAAGISAYAGMSSGDDMEKELKKQRKLMESQLEFAKERWSHYRDTYGDLEKVLVSQAQRGYQADYEGVTSRATADVASQFDTEREEAERRRARYGIDPGSGRAEAEAREYGIAEASARAGAINTAREGERRHAEETTYRRRAQVHGIGARLSADAARDVLRVGDRLAQFHGQNADAYGKMASNLFSNAGALGMYGLTRDPGAGDGGGGSDGYGPASDDYYKATYGLPPRNPAMSPASPGRPYGPG